MLKKMNVDEPIYPEARVRVVTNEFSGLGINGHVNDMFLIAANVPAPPCLLLEFRTLRRPGTVQCHPVRPGGARVVMRANTPRVEPKPAITLMLTAAEVCAELGWSKSDLDVACASGLKPSGWREVHGEDGVSIGLQPLFDPETVTRSLLASKRCP